MNRVFSGLLLRIRRWEKFFLLLLLFSVWAVLLQAAESGPAPDAGTSTQMPAVLPTSAEPAAASGEKELGAVAPSPLKMKFRWTGLAVPFAKAYELPKSSCVLHTRLELSSPQQPGEWSDGLQFVLSGSTQLHWRFFSDRPNDATLLDTQLIRTATASNKIQLRIADGPNQEPVLIPQDGGLYLFSPEMFSQLIRIRIGKYTRKDARNHVFEVELVFQRVPLLFNNRLLLLSPQGGETLTVGTVEVAFE